MPVNPMQRKARNSFLLGMIITLLVCAIVGGLAYFLLSNKNKNKQQEEGTLTYAYRLKRDVKALEDITASDVEEVVVTTKAVPTGAYASKTQKTDAKGKTTWTTKAFPAGKKAKVALNAGTIMCDALVIEYDSGLIETSEDGTSKYLNDVRYVEYNMLTLGTTITEGDYVDIRITFLNGQDLIVVSKKEVKSILGDTVGFEMTEGEINLMESAIVEAYIMTGSKFYVAQYVEPGEQTAATKTYVPTVAVQELIINNPNITNTAKRELGARFDSSIRERMDQNVNVYSEEAKQNVELGIQEEIENAKKAREAYLSGLTSY